MNNSNQIENKTGELYNSCFNVLNESQWLCQGELLAEQLGLDENIVKDKVCLDGGCGHGALCYFVSKLGAKKVIGVDLEPTPYEGKFIDGKVEFVKTSLMNLPFESNSFDVVFSSGVLHHTINPEKGAAELARILKPGGKLIIGVYGKYGLFPWLLWLARILTVKIPVIPYKFIDNLTIKFKLDPIWRYQVLDYLYVPILRRYTPKQVKEKFFLANNISNPVRVSNITVEKGKKFTNQNTSYSYDYRTLKSRILFGHGFIVIEGIK